MKTEITPIHAEQAAFRRFDRSKPGHWLTCRLRLTWLRYRRWSAARQAIRHLRELDEYLLDDVGIDRWQITEVALGGKGSRQNPAQQPVKNPCAKLAA